MTRPARLFLATLVALLACATASVTPALATYGKIKVVKDLTPAADSGRFDLKVGSTTVRTRAGDDDYGSATVHAGTYTVSEAAASGTALTDYTSSIDCRRNGISIRSGTGTSLGGIAVKVGDQIVCTITNVRLGKFEIEKQTDPANSSASFGFSSSLAGAFSLSDDGVKTVTRVTPNQGGSHYTVVESTTPGWRLTSVSCGSDGDSSGSLANRTASVRVSPGETVHCKFVNKQIAPAIDVVKDGPALVHHGDTMTFGFAVTNPGNSPLHDVRVSDDHCAPVSTMPTERRDDDGDGLLELGETWIFTCTMPVPAHAADEEDPIHNVATATGSDEQDRPVTDTDDHDTDILHPAINIVKSADPTQAYVGDTITYRFDVTNPGDTGLTVSFGDPRCDTDKLTGPVKAIGNADDRLEPGELWHYECTHVIVASDPDPLPNSATATGTDVLGGPEGTVSDDDSASVDILQRASPPALQALEPAPEIHVLAQRALSGRASLSGPSGCTARAFTAVVRGRQIRRVTFYVDGRRFRQVIARKGRTRFTARIHPAGHALGVHRVTARVVFVRESGTRARTLVMVFQRCARRQARPVFTG
ncbi:MAG TPA: hypothetical protein VES79_08975 [Solirubrobacteraceae bacterium]|nr:hypothetical protein [Solirubrobacteraceae bacterium]